jgi:hypothetical protein
MLHFGPDERELQLFISSSPPAPWTIHVFPGSPGPLGSDDRRARQEQHGAVATPISAEVKSLANSKGQMDVDEEGRIIRRGSNLGKAAAGSALGGVFGGLKGAAIGAGSGAVASIVLIEVAADGPSIRLDPGSTVTLSAKSRSGPGLETGGQIRPGVPIRYRSNPPRRRRSRRH